MQNAECTFAKRSSPSRAAFLIWVCVKLVARWRSPRPSASSWRRCSRWRLRCQRRASTRILWTIKRSAPGPARSTHASETRERALEGRIACRSMLSRDAAPGLSPNDCGGRRVCRPTSARSEWKRVSAREIQLIHRARTTFTSSTASGTVAAAALCTVAARTRAARTQKTELEKRRIPCNMGVRAIAHLRATTSAYRSRTNARRAQKVWKWMYDSGRLPQMETVENGGPIDVPVYVPNKRRARVRGLSDFNIPQKRKSSLPGLDWRRHSFASIAPTSPFMPRRPPIPAHPAVASPHRPCRVAARGGRSWRAGATRGQGGLEAMVPARVRVGARV